MELLPVQRISHSVTQVKFVFSNIYSSLSLPDIIAEHITWYGISLWSVGVSCPGSTPSSNLLPTLSLLAGAAKSEQSNS